MKRKITVTKTDVTVTEDDPITHERVSRTYFVWGGHVHFRDRNGQLRQVCERLSTVGSTLKCAPDDLPTVIRRELGRANRAQRARRALEEA